MIFRGGARSPLIRIASTIAKVLIFRGLLGKGLAGKASKGLAAGQTRQIALIRLIRMSANWSGMEKPPQIPGHTVIPEGGSSSPTPPGSTMTDVQTGVR